MEKSNSSLIMVQVITYRQKDYKGFCFYAAIWLSLRKKIENDKIKTSITKSKPGVFFLKKIDRVLSFPVILLGFVMGLLAGCSPKRLTVAVPVDITPNFSVSGQEAVSARWWTSFGDQRLNTLVDAALEANLDLQTAWQRLQAARAVVNRESSSLWPEFDASIGAETSSPSSNPGGDQNLRLEMSSEYEVDLWGRIRSAVDARRFQARATYNDYQTAAVSISAEITGTWYQLVEAKQQLELIEEQIKTNEKVLFLLKARLGSGQIRSVDILRQKQLIESTREQKISTESGIQVLEHQLAVLLGRSPQQGIEYRGERLPALPPLPAAGIPADLIRRRPDVQSAYIRLQAADRDLASAVSSRYPRLSLTASLTKNTDSTRNLFKDWVRSLAGNLLAPIFYGGRLNAEVKRTKAVKQQRLFEYGQTVLTAFKEVEDALIQEKKQVERIRSLEVQLKLAGQTHAQLRIEYFNGLADYLDVLTSLDDEQQLHRNLLSARRILLEYRIALYRALAGGFETNRETDNNGKTTYK
jgi:NodT family efflux transporter outer membrane factor (OMF) lipoprotein